MTPITRLLSLALLAATLLACRGDAGSSPAAATATAEPDTATLLIDSIAPLPDDPPSSIIHSLTLPDGSTRQFFQVSHDGCYYLCAATAGKTSRTDTLSTATPEYDFESPHPISYKITPDGAAIFLAVHNINASDGWVTEYRLLRLNCRSLKVRTIGYYAALMATKIGIIAADARITNPEATAVADRLWLLHDVTFDWNGNRLSVSPHEYDNEAMEQRFSSTADGTPSTAPRGFLTPAP